MLTPVAFGESVGENERLTFMAPLFPSRGKLGVEGRSEEGRGRKGIGGGMSPCPIIAANRTADVIKCTFPSH